MDWEFRDSNSGQSLCSKKETIESTSPRIVYSEGIIEVLSPNFSAVSARYWTDTGNGHPVSATLEVFVCDQGKEVRNGGGRCECEAVYLAIGQKRPDFMGVLFRQNGLVGRDDVNLRAPFPEFFGQYFAGNHCARHEKTLFAHAVLVTGRPVWLRRGIRKEPGPGAA